jgi:hypothetical protein
MLSAAGGHLEFPGDDVKFPNGERHLSGTCQAFEERELVSH